jgi:hypothetical protein
MAAANPRCLRERFCGSAQNILWNAPRDRRERNARFHRNMTACPQERIYIWINTEYFILIRKD